jgi:ribokinase
VEKKTRVICCGSLNIDHVYQVDHFVRAGETMPTVGYQVFPGGKGFNQSIALARAGVRVFHAGKTGDDGLWLVERLRECGVDASFVHRSREATGHAVIQVQPDGENAIFIHGGANRDIDLEMVHQTLAEFNPGEYLLLQNEVNQVGEMIGHGAARGLAVIFNPAPFSTEVFSYPLDKVSTFVVNEVEGAAMTGAEKPADILQVMNQRYPNAATCLTLGRKGVLYGDRAQSVLVPARKVEAVDTTGTGDTFIGFWLGAILRGRPTQTALEEGCRAAALCAMRRGAADSIPSREEVNRSFG